jgi:hypothetical protein
LIPIKYYCDGDPSEILVVLSAAAELDALIYYIEPKHTKPGRSVQQRDFNVEKTLLNENLGHIGNSKARSKLSAPMHTFGSLSDHFCVAPANLV